MTIHISGGNGQLGLCLKDHLDPSAIFTTRDELDISKAESVRNYFQKNSPSLFINCAAYTQVDLAESQKEKVMSTNADALIYLSDACNQKKIPLIHISTDYVFDGEKEGLYSEDDATNPLGVYGQSKLRGERIIQDSAENYLIIRTSWVYSEYQNNFVKTMLRLAKERDEIYVVNDQWGCPTYAQDLAELLKILSKKDLLGMKGIYHFSNEGRITWFDFAKEIFKIKEIPIKVNPIRTEDYPTKTPRPKNSAFGKEKIKKDFGIKLSYWKDSLRACLERL